MSGTHVDRASMGPGVGQQGKGGDGLAVEVCLVEGGKIYIAEDVAVVDDEVVVMTVEVAHETG